MSFNFLFLNNFQWLKGVFDNTSESETSNCMASQSIYGTIIAISAGTSHPDLPDWYMLSVFKFWAFKKWAKHRNANRDKGFNRLFMIYIFVYWSLSHLSLLC